VEAHVSPNPSHYVDVNVIRMDLLSQLQTTIFGKDFEFEVTNIEHTVQRQGKGTAREPSIGEQLLHKQY
jgi:hypothetical protein